MKSILGKFGFASFAALAVIILAPSAAIAQEEALEEITVTGSRLKANPNLAAAVPVLSVTGSEGLDRGNVRVEDFINTLPQVMAGQASEMANGSSGTATLNLRGLGRNRTLVLMDGRRLPYGSSAISAANLDLIPLQLVERVDILTGGASAVYGSDAVGGVANFILKDDFEGVELGIQYGNSYSSNSNDFWGNVLRAGSQPVPGSVTDGQETLFYMILGGNLQDGRGNVTLFASYEDREEISQADRIESGCALGQDDSAESFGGFGCVGSSNFRAFKGATGLIDPGTGLPFGTHFQQADGTLIPFVGGPSTTYNFGPENFFQRPSERYTIVGKGNYDVSENLEAFVDFSYTNNVSDSQIAPTASFGSTYTVNCDNPFLTGSPGTVQMTDLYGCSAADIAAGTTKSSSRLSHRNVEGGPRSSLRENTALRMAAGLRGSFADDVWNWDVFIQNSETRDQDISTNDFVISKLDQAILAVDDGAGNVVCQDQSGGCVPYNIFQRTAAGETLVTPEQTAFIHGIGIVNGDTSQFGWGGTIQADLGEYGWQIPWADYGVSFLFGYEFRKDDLRSRPDEISQVPGGGFTGVGGATLAVVGEMEVNEFFTEWEVPLVSGRTGLQELTFRLQARTSDYEGVGTTGGAATSTFDVDSYGYSLAWAPIDQLRFRAQYQRAVRAPNVIELYTGQNTNLPDLNPAGTNSAGVQLFDPCSSAFPIASLAACQNTGLTAAQYGSGLVDDVISGQTQSLTGGNPDLFEETADTYTFGFVWTPEFIEGLSLSVDYFSILVEDAIEAGIDAQVILDRCLADGTPVLCDLMQRAFDGTLSSGTPGVGFQNTNVNIGELETEGFDVQVGYVFDAGRHSHNFDYAATILDQLDEVPFDGAAPIECAGKFANPCSPPSPEYRHRLLYTWQTPWSIDVTTTWRHYGGVDTINAAETLELKLDEANYIDLSANWFLMDDSITIRLSILNVFEEDLPVFTGAGTAPGNGNAYPSMYDTSTTYMAALKYNF